MPVRLAIRTALGVLFLAVLAFANDSKNDSKDSKKSDSTAGAGPLPGISYQWKDLPLDPGAEKDSHLRKLCFDLVGVPKWSAGYSTTQPFILQPRQLSKDADSAKNAPKNCEQIGDKNPLLAGDRLAIAIWVDPAKANTSGLLLVNFNVTAQNVSPINSAPLRPSFSTSPIGPTDMVIFPEKTPGPTTVPTPYPTPSGPFSRYLAWPYPLTGDTGVTVTIIAVYSPEGLAEKLFKIDSKTLPVDEGQVPLLNITLPQVHQRYRFNIATGVVVSSLRNPTFFHGDAATPIVKDDGSWTASPVLMFSGYFWSMDAERKWSIKDARPALTFGLSLSSPGNSFFFGGSSEGPRNVQWNYGINYGKVNRLAPTGALDTPSGTPPQTVQKFSHGYYFGLTFNFDFIKGIFGGGGDKGGGGGGGKSGS